MTALLRLVWAVRLELQPRDEVGQFVVQLLEALAVGFLKRTEDVLVGVRTHRPVRLGEENADRDVSRLYRRVIPVLEHLDPADHALRKERPDVLLDTSGPRLRHVFLLAYTTFAHNTCKS
jgi:hypothetical protein